MLRLCAQLCQYQCVLGRHFHIEQPLTSEILAQQCMRPVVTATQPVQVDMCQFGLKLPGSLKYIRKSTIIRSTSLKVIRELEGKISGG